MKVFKFKFVLIICMMITLSSNSQWFGTSLAGQTYRYGDVEIGQTVAAPNSLLIVGFANGTTGNISQWHAGTYGSKTSNSAFWMDLGMVNPNEYGYRIQAGESVGKIQLNKTNGLYYDMDIMWGTESGTDRHNNLYFRYGYLTTTNQTNANVIAGLNSYQTMAIGNNATAQVIANFSSSFADASLYVQRHISVGFGGGSFGWTSNPLNALTSYGAASIGINYASTNAPTNGLIVEGIVGIHNDAPDSRATLDIGGDIIMGDPNEGTLGSRFLIHTRHGFSSPGPGDFWIFSADDASHNYFNNTDLIYGRVNNTWAIGTAPTSSYVFTVNGSALASGGVWQNSDERLKVDIKKIVNPLESLKKLDAVTYTFKQDIMVDKLGSPTKLNLPTEKQYGFIAQEVQKNFPELVKEGIGGYLALNYTEFIPMLVAGITKQQEQIEQLQTQLQEAQIKLACLPICDGAKPSYNQNSSSGELGS
jgi:hypothetical protein